MSIDMGRRIVHCLHNIGMSDNFWIFCLHKSPWRSNQRTFLEMSLHDVADDVSKLSWSDLLQLSFGQTSTSTMVRVGEEALGK